MSLKINNNTITAQNLTGGNSDAKYFNSNLTQLVPNKTGYKLFGSPLQRQQLKQFVNDSFAHNINYTPKITDIVNPGDNTNLYESVYYSHKIVSGFYNNKYILLNNKFNVGNLTWEIHYKIITGDVTTDYMLVQGAANAIDYQVPLIGYKNSHFCLLLSSNGSAWDIYNGTGNTTISSNTTYYLKLIFNGTNYILYYSLNGQNWLEEINIVSSTPIFSPQTAEFAIGLNHFNSSVYQPFNGSIDLTDAYIKINGEYFFNGSTAVEGTDYTIVGSPTITEEPMLVIVPSPFTFSFDLDSSAITEGTKYLLEHPNLIKVKTENNDLYFNFPWKSNKWYYLPDDILVEDVNSISLVTPQTGSLNTPYYAYSYNNNSVYTLTTNLIFNFELENASASGELIKYSDCYSGFSTSSFITINKPITGTIDSLEMVFKIKKTSYSNRQVIIGNVSSNRDCPQIEIQNSNKCWYAIPNGNGSDWISVQGTHILATNDKDYWVKMVANNGTLNCYVSEDGITWIPDGSVSYSTTSWSASTARLGIDVNESTSVFKGSIYMGSSYIKINGTTYIYGDFTTLITPLYNSSYELLDVTAIKDGDNISIDGHTYIRTTNNDIIRVIETSNTIKLSVNNHNFTLVASGEDMPTITTGVLGYKEDLIF